MLESAGLAVVARGGLFHGLLPVRGARSCASGTARRTHDPHRDRRLAGRRRADQAIDLALDSREPGCRWPWGRGHFPPLPGLSTWALCRRRHSGAPAVTADAAPVIVVPCFNEERRLDERAFGDMARHRQVRLLFVDDGSTDDTARVLAGWPQADDGIEVLRWPSNAGQGRGRPARPAGGGARRAPLSSGTTTPTWRRHPSELVRLTETLQARPDLVGVFGSRVARLGSSIERSAVRHYLGRAYATLASMALGITVYDTQCGAKVFRVNETFVAALAEPFRLGVGLRRRAAAPPAARDLEGTGTARDRLRRGPPRGVARRGRLEDAHRPRHAPPCVGLARIARSRRAHERAGPGAPSRGTPAPAAPAPLHLARRDTPAATGADPTGSRRKRA